ncbi:hypothetical protein ABIF68_004256 [Bradyrhizobium japonicum]|uniref:hypothetical protein n=3 Tax=Nitrobacteraceae TaxID=41294 RepID=UPI0006766926|nr:hypothetical protein [Bradyrhizobium japonicum]MCP1777391.1 hypothetical protein [Bradyrhizobium japonicum]MCP1959609.1 hypothetical protein [Bradyrhizobium japonicum]
MMMSIRLGVTVVAATFLFGSVSSLRAAGGASAPVTMSSPGSVDAMKFADLSRQAPIGHRQPRRSDVPGSTQSSPEDAELQRLDKGVDRRLIICRGC